MFAVLALLAGVGWYYRETLDPYLWAIGLGKPTTVAPPTPRPTPVSTATVEQRDIPLYLNGLGTVTALKTVTIRSRVEGEITQIAFTEGEMVQEGDLLAEIDPRPYQVQKDQAEGQLARDEATLTAARRTLVRLKQLFEMKIATAQQVDEQTGLVQQYEGALKADHAQVAQAELQLTYSQILAPISGRIGLRLVDEGNMVRPNDVQGLAVITQLQPIAIVFTLPQDDISRVQQRMHAEGTLTVEAYDRELRNRLATGKLAAIDNQVDPTNGTVRLKAEFENQDGMLFPNQFVNVRLLVETQSGALVVPGAAVQRGPNGTFVYVVASDDTVELRNVAVSASEGGQTAIVKGLSAGEIVVTAGLDRLRPGAPVSTKSAEAEQPGPDRAAPRRPGESESRPSSTYHRS
ncbi:MAG TPA: MdtA/MuxA family multidrug efflux RND transporter periplasmic adaptor subunit [Planctomycetaceae bacterium]|nr:MdtA/MuxA family multidrug efflux RND transporter periplasmic adaptor subunit [Planctomycetaceae bacterium]